MVLNLASALPSDQVETHIGALIGSGALMEQAAQRNLPAIHFQFKFPADPRGIARLVSYCRKHKIQIVQSHGLRADAIARWACRLAGVSVIISTLHSIDPWRRPPHVLLDRMTAPFVTKYIAVCEAAKNAAINREGIQPNKIQVIPIGVPPQVIPRERRDELRNQYDVAENAWPVIGVLANLRDMKGHRHIIQALPAILQENPDAVFLFAGRDDSEGAIREVARHSGVDSAIRFLGFVEDTPSVFAAMDVFLLPSDWEGFPVSILEAMQAGVPVIATHVGGIPEMIRDGQDGLLIPPKNPDAIALTVNRLAKDFALRATLARSADAHFQSSFTVDTMVQRMSKLFTELLKKT